MLDLHRRPISRAEVRVVAQDRKRRKIWEGINMRRVVVLALLALALRIAAWADDIVLTNMFGSVSISNSGVSSFGSQLHSFNCITAPAGHSLRAVSYNTRDLASGSITGGGTFDAWATSSVIVTDQ